MVKSQYSILIGAKKTLKNVLIMYGPVMVIFLTILADYIPTEYTLLGALVAAVAYFIKNYLENRV